MERISFPITGNSVIMAVVILVHVFIAFMVVGATVMAVYYHWRGMKNDDSLQIQFARRTTELVAKVMKVNGVLGVVIVVLTIGLWGDFAKVLYNVLFWAFAIEGVFFLGLMAASNLYSGHWHDRELKRPIVAGMILSIFGLLAAFVINGIWAFMMMPGDWLRTKSRWDAFFNPIVFESFLHLLIPCFLNAALAGFLWTWYRETRTPDSDYYRRMNRSLAKFAAVVIFLQPLSGLGFFLKVRSASSGLMDPTPYKQLLGGPATPFFIIMISLGVIAVTGSVIYLVKGHEIGRKALLATAMAAMLAFVSGAYTREKMRKPYLIHSYMPMNMITADSKPAEIPAGDGAAIYKSLGCDSCHSIHGKGGSAGPELKDLKVNYDTEKLKKFLVNPGENMPPFEGPEEQLKALVKYLLTI